MNATNTADERHDADGRQFCDFSVITTAVTTTEVAELYVIGSALRDAEMASEALRKLGPCDFATYHHRLTFESIGRVVAQKRNPDSIAVFDDLKRSNSAADFPGENPVKFLADSLTFCITGNHFDHFLTTVKDHSAKRAMWRLNRSLCAELSYSPTGQEGATGQQWARRPAGEIAAEYALKIAQAGEDGSVVELISMQQAATDAVRQIDECHRPRQADSVVRTAGITTGIRSIDDIIPSFEPGSLGIIAARPGVGKSSLMLQIARNAAADGGHVLFFSLEMPAAQLALRLIAMTSLVPLSAIRGHRKLTDAEAEAVFEANGAISNLPIRFGEQRGVTASEIAGEMKRATRRFGKPSVVFADYLQLIRAENARDNRNYQLGQITKILRNAAGDIGAPIVCGAQMSREIESRNDSPRLSDLRDSGEIEQDADIVAFLHPSAATVRQAIVDVSFIVAKQRNGPTGEVPLQFIRSLTKFVEPSVPM